MLRDTTDHDIAEHFTNIEDEQQREYLIKRTFSEDNTFKSGKSPNWYKFWSAKNECPVCHVPATFELTDDD